MKEMTIKSAECDVCEEYKLCWHVSLVDVCSACLETGSAVIRAVADFGFIDASTTPKTKPPAKKDAK